MKVKLEPRRSILILFYTSSLKDNEFKKFEDLATETRPNQTMPELKHNNNNNNNCLWVSAPTSVLRRTLPGFEPQFSVPSETDHNSFHPNYNLVSFRKIKKSVKQLPPIYPQSILYMVQYKILDSHTFY